LLDAGREKGLLPCGLGARDTLRLEARMCLYGMDMDETTTLVEAGLGWIVSTDEAKGDYPGRDVLADQKKSGPPRKLVGFEVSRATRAPSASPTTRRSSSATWSTWSCPRRDGSSRSTRPSGRWSR